MSEQNEPRRRGRPATGNAMTAAERMARTRQKAREAITQVGADLSTLSDTGLFEALRLAHRDRATADITRLVKELYRRHEALSGRPLDAPFIATVANQDNTATVAVNTDQDMARLEHRAETMDPAFLLEQKEAIAGENVRLERRCSELTKEVARLKTDSRLSGVDALKAEVARLQASLVERDELLARDRSECTRLKSEVERLKGNERGFREQISRLEARNAVTPPAAAPPPAAATNNRQRTYPEDVRKMAIEMDDAGAKSRDICTAIHARVGFDPTTKNLKMLIEGWKAKAAQQAGL